MFVRFRRAQALGGRCRMSRPKASNLSHSIAALGLLTTDCNNFVNNAAQCVRAARGIHLIIGGRTPLVTVWNAEGDEDEDDDKGNVDGGSAGAAT